MYLRDAVAQLVKNPSANAGDERDVGSIPLSGKVHGQGSLGRLTVHGVAESGTTELTRTLWTLGRVKASLPIAKQTHYKYIWFKSPTGTAVSQVRNRVCEQHFLKLELQDRLSPLYFFTLFFSCFFHFF